MSLICYELVAVYNLSRPGRIAIIDDACNTACSLMVASRRKNNTNKNAVDYCCYGNTSGSGPCSSQERKG